MEHYVRRENVRLYRRLLADPKVVLDQVRQRELHRLLAAELAKDETTTGRQD